MKQRFIHFSQSEFPIILFGTFILLAVALFNGYPLVYSDSGTYIKSGIEGFVPPDRPIIYGLFIAFFSFEYSLWLVILAQNLLTAFVLFEVFKFLKGLGCQYLGYFSGQFQEKELDYSLAEDFSVEKLGRQ